LEDLGIDGPVLLKLILKKFGERLWTAFIWIRIQILLRAVVMVVMNRHVPTDARKFSTEELLSVPELLWYTELIE
jgi:hypothetical protein